MSGVCRAAAVAMATHKWTQRLNMKLPLDSVLDSSVRGNNRGVVFSRVAPTPLQTPPRLAAYSSDAIRDLLDISDPEQMVAGQEFLDLVAGNSTVPSCEPLAHRYGGHQFGMWAGQLGDGRAILLGEYTNEKGERWEMQLKGAGKTPYSRFADGRAVIRSSVREFLCSEAMYYLGIPTSRALSLVVCDDLVARDQFYTGEPRLERVAVLLRAAPSWFRFGSLEMPYRDDDRLILLTLVDHFCRYHFPAVLEEGRGRFAAMAAEIAQATARLVAAWQSVGFAHGVLNTDNMSIHGVTIDYGPFGFVERYSPHFVPNTSDTAGLYRLGKQPAVCRWNVARLLETLEPFMSPEELTNGHRALYLFDAEFTTESRRLAAVKLGLLPSSTETQPSEALDQSASTAVAPAEARDQSASAAVAAAEARDQSAPSVGAEARDHSTDQSAINPQTPPQPVAATDTNNEIETRDEAAVTVAGARDDSAVTTAGAREAECEDRFSLIAARATAVLECRHSPEQLHSRLLNMMQQTGADFTATWRQLGEIPLVELTEAAAVSDGQLRLGTRYWALRQLLGCAELLQWLQDYSRELELREIGEEERRSRMCAANPRYVLRNWMAQVAIEGAERDDFDALRHIQQVLSQPFTEQESAEEAGFSEPGPDWAQKLRVSCSS